MTDTITVETIDGTTEDIGIRITGTNDVPEITGGAVVFDNITGLLYTSDAAADLTLCTFVCVRRLTHQYHV